MYNENENKSQETEENIYSQGTETQTDNTVSAENSSATAGTTETVTEDNQNSDSAGQTGSVYRYSKDYYDNNRDENNSYQYNTTSTQSSYGNSSQSSYTGGGTAYSGNNQTYGSNSSTSSYQYQQTYTQAEDPKAAKKREKQLKKQQRKAAHKGRASKVAMSVAGLVAVAAVAMGSTYASLQIFGEDSQGQVVIQSTSTGASGNSTKKVSTTTSGNTVVTTDVSSMVSEVMPSVVTISNVGTETYNSFFGQSGTYEYTSSGSGIIAGQSDKELLIVTNQHVISGADTINVTFVDGKEYTADVKGSDSTIDLAVIAISIEDIEEDTLSKIKVATLGDSSKLSVGEPAIAIGNAMGYGQSVTTGVISALNREVTIEDVTNSLIQTDAAINPGNSGGALLNLAGEVIGINSVKYASTEVEGMGYAIPISDVTDVINEMMNNETKKKVETENSGYLGIKGVEINSSVSETYNMPKGVYVADVEKDGAADKAGIKKGDIITKIAGTTVSSTDDLLTELEYHEAGSKVEVVVQTPIEDGYGYNEKKFEVTLDKREE